MAKPVSCHTCIYAHRDLGLWMRTLWSGFPARPLCGNQPDSYGRMKECPHGRVCRNYRPRPPVPTGENVKMIPLTNGCYAYVDAADYEWLNQWHWFVLNGYAARHEKGKVILMHRQIMQPPKGKVVDHINGNKFDNTRANMRNVTQRQNIYNRGKRVGAGSIYKGVSYDKSRGNWRVMLYFDGKHFFLGSFDTEVEAARAYDRQAVEFFKECAWLNFPEEWPPQRRAEVYAQCQAAGKREGRRRRTRERGPKAQHEDKSGRREGKKGRTKEGKSRAGVKRGGARRRTRERGPKPLHDHKRRKRGDCAEIINRKSSIINPKGVGGPRAAKRRRSSAKSG